MPNRVQLFGIEIDPLTMSQSIESLLGFIASSDYSCRYVVTPNVDHIVKLRNDPGFQTAYRNADLVLVDGKPVLFASRLLGKPLPETVCGSDLLPALFTASEAVGGLSLFLLGAQEGVADKAARNISDRWPWVRISGFYSPPMDFSAGSPESELAIALIRSSAPDVLAIGLGAPKQEIWVHNVRSRLNTKAALCVGATIDFLGEKRARAPIWMRRAGIEWIHRMLSEPQRMGKRYVHDAWVFPQLLAREWLKSK
jgi:N-acetylglucosaminyldiphosphoundecaprenol N-acetyl-beta-D-mannosaminyltransferase